MISIGILTFNSPKTLKNSLESYKISGILDYTDDIKCLIQPSQLQNEEIRLCKEYKIKYILENTNTMMAGAIKKLVRAAKYELFLFLEADFRSCKSKTVNNKILDFAASKLQSKQLDVVRLRNLKNPGHPIHWSLQKKDGINYNNNSELYLCTHYLKNPHIVYANFIKKINNSPILYEMNSKNCVYTNNPNLTSRSFYEKNILPFAIDGKHLEPEIFHYWNNANFKIGISSGIFTHVRIDGHEGKKCYCCPEEMGGFSNNINCVCCTEPYKPRSFDPNIDISNSLDDVLDEEKLNKIYNNLQFKYFSNGAE